MQTVNGYICHNCTDVANAKKGVDPAHPKDPPKSAERTPTDRGPAVTFGGRLKQGDPVRQASPAAYTSGSTISLSA